jgi:hypothetical protein
VCGCACSTCFRQRDPALSAGGTAAESWEALGDGTDETIEALTSDQSAVRFQAMREHRKELKLIRRKYWEGLAEDQSQAVDVNELLFGPRFASGFKTKELTAAPTPVPLV